jgi:hypothetical protein
MSQRRHRRSYNEPGHAHELTFSVYHRYPFLKAERTCQWLVEAINAMRSELEVKVWAYVFMPDHAHLLIYRGTGTEGDRASPSALPAVASAPRGTQEEPRAISLLAKRRRL